MIFRVPSLLKKPKILVNTENINTILDISNIIIIQGTGGIGKSTLLNHLFINELKNKDLIPVFIELKDINLIENDYTILDIIFDKLTNLGSLVSISCNLIYASPKLKHNPKSNPSFPDMHLHIPP